MPRILSIDPRVPTLHGVLIPRAAVESHERAYITLQQARAYARQVSKTAQAMAASVQQQAMREGFMAGWLDSMNAIYRALSERNSLFQQIEQTLKDAVKRELEMALQQPDLELHLLETWLAAGHKVGDSLQIILPKHALTQVEQIKRRVQSALGLDASISVGDGDNVTIQSGDQVYEFSPDRSKGELNELAHRCFQRLEVRKQNTQWSQEIVQHWFSEMQQRYNVELSEKYDTEFEDEFFDDFEDEPGYQRSES